MSLLLYRGGVRNWTDAQILEIYNSMLLADSALAYSDNLAYLRLGPYLAAADTDAHFNRRMLEAHDGVYEPANTPPFEFRAGAANKDLEQALLDSGYAGAVPVVLSQVHWAVFEVSPGVYVEEDSNLVLSGGAFGGEAAKLRMVLAGPNVTLTEGEGTLTISAATTPALLEEVASLREDLEVLEQDVALLEANSQQLLVNGPMPTVSTQVLTLLDAERSRIDRVQIEFGLVLDRIDDYWRLALGLRGVPGGVPVLDQQGNLVRAKSLVAGANVQLTDVGGLVTISSDASEADLAALAARIAILENTSQVRLTNGPLPPEGAQVLTLLVPELGRIDRIEVSNGLLLERVEPAGYWRLSARLLSVIAANATPLILTTGSVQSLKCLAAGANVSLADAGGVVTLAADVAQADLEALAERLDGLELTSQPMLENGPLPPEGAQVLTLLVPELGRIDRIEVSNGLLLERVDLMRADPEDHPSGYWRLSARLLSVIAANAAPLILTAGSVQSLKCLAAGANVGLEDSGGVLTISANLGTVNAAIDLLEADVLVIFGRLDELANSSQPTLVNGPLPEGNVVTLLSGNTIERLLMGSGLRAYREEGYWRLALEIAVVPDVDAVRLLEAEGGLLTLKSLKAGPNVGFQVVNGVLTISASFEQVGPPPETPPGSVDLINDLVIRSLLAGENVGLAQADDVVTVSVPLEVVQRTGGHYLISGSPLRTYPLVAGANVQLQTRFDAEFFKEDVLISVNLDAVNASLNLLSDDVLVIFGRLDELGGSTQTTLTNGPLPPGEQVLTLLNVEQGRIDRIEVGYGLNLKLDPAGYWKLKAQGLLGVLAPDAIPLISSSATEQAIKSLKAGPNVSLSETSGVVTVSMALQEVSPGTGNHHVVHGSPLKSYPLVAGNGISITTRVDAQGNKKDVMIRADPFIQIWDQADVPFTKHFVLEDYKILPLIAGDGITIETVPYDAPPYIPDYIRFSVPGIAALQTRVQALEGLGGEVPGKLRINDANARDTGSIFHIGGDRIMFNRSDSHTMVVENLAVRSIGGTNTTFSATPSNTRLSQYQMQVSNENSWVKTLTVETSITAPQITALQTGLTAATGNYNSLLTTTTALGTRVGTLEIEKIVPRTANVPENEQFHVLRGTALLPLVAGPNVRLETVNRTLIGGLTSPDYVRISAAPFVAGRLRSDGVKLTSLGMYDYTTSGRTGAADGLLISWVNPPHPANLDFVMLVTPLPLAQGRERIFWNTWIGSSRSFRIYMSDFNGNGVDRHLTFAVF